MNASGWMENRFQTRHLPVCFTDTTERKENGGRRPSSSELFEFLFGMAMAGFEEAGVEYVILETGLGGRLDATNSISGPLTCILTSIGLDHTEILGNTLGRDCGRKGRNLKAACSCHICRYTAGEQSGY